MAGAAPKTAKWTARENKHQKPDTLLMVTGQVQVGSTNKIVELKEAGSPGGKGKPLALDLSIKAGSGPGSDVMVWMAAKFSRQVAVDQYNDIEIRWDGKTIATCKVLDDKEHAQHVAKLTQAANAQTARKSKPKTKTKAKPASRPKAKTKTKTKTKAKKKKAVAKRTARKVAKKGKKKRH